MHNLRKLIHVTAILTQLKITTTQNVTHTTLLSEEDSHDCSPLISKIMKLDLLNLDKLKKIKYYDCRKYDIEAGFYTQKHCRLTYSECKSVIYLDLLCDVYPSLQNLQDIVFNAKTNSPKICGKLSVDDIDKILTIRQSSRSERVQVNVLLMLIFVLNAAFVSLSGMFSM